MSSSWASRARPVIGTRVRTPEDAAAVLRTALGRVREPSIAALFLDASQAVIALVPVRQKRTAALLRAFEREDTRAVIGAVLGADDDRMPDAPAREAWSRARAVLADDGITLLDWLDVRDDAWKSLVPDATGWEAA